MSDNFHRYLAKLDELRALRAAGRDRDEETEVLDEMDEIWEALTEPEREGAREESWRAWPNQHAERLAQKRTLREAAPWGKGQLRVPPRYKREAA